VRLLMTLTVLALLPACSTSFFIKDINAYKPEPLNDTTVMPDQQYLRQVEAIPRVVLLSMNENPDANIDNQEFQRQAKESLNFAVLKKVNFVSDAAHEASLREAVRSGQALKEDIDADFLMVSKITSIKFDSQYKESNKEVDGSIYIAGHCDNNTMVSLELTAYKMPSMIKVSSTTLTSTMGKQVAAKGKNNLRVVKKTNTEMANLFLDAIDNKSKSAEKCEYSDEMKKQDAKAATLKTVSVDTSQLVPSTELSKLVSNMVSPVGYILDKRSNGEKTIFKISLGHKQGLEPKVDMAIVKLHEPADAQNFEMNLDKLKIGSGEVSNILSANESWMVVEDEKVAHMISKGDIVKVQYTFSPWKP